jgi:hypothetical protein
VIEIKGMNKLDKIGRNAKALFTCGWVGRNSSFPMTRWNVFSTPTKEFRR